MINRAAVCLRRAMIEIAGNVSLFIFTAFLVVGILPMDIFKWHLEAFSLLERYVVVPWGMALCLLRLERRAQEGEGSVRADAAVLFVLLAWIVVPFAIRFGVTFVNIRSWASSAIVFFGIYLLLTEKSEAERGRLLDLSGWLFTLTAIVWGGALLYCAAAVKSYGADVDLYSASGATGGFGFGVFKGQYLCSGVHYNNTGMFATSMAMYSLSGLSRSKAKIGKLIHGLAFAIMAVVVVLTQSRTSRYALIAALAVGAYGWFVSRKFMKRAFAAHAAGLVLAAALMLCLYQGMSMLTDAALRHFAQQGTKAVPVAMIVKSAAADEETAEKKPEKEVPKARDAVDSTFSGRTDLWRNLFKLWKENPKYLVIGNGIGRTGSRIVQGTMHEKIGGVAVHNTYLQYIADFGLIGFGLMAAFMAMMIAPFMRVLFAQDAPGCRAHCMMVVIAVATGIMESPPLTAMSPINIMLFFSLGQIMARSRDMQSLV